MAAITAAQLRAARGLLDWSREELARRAGLSTRTIRNLEKGFISPRDATASGLCEAFYGVGIVFPPEGGVRRELPEVKTIEGEDGKEILFESILREVKEKGGEIVGSFTSYVAILRSIASSESVALERLGKLKSYACLRLVVASLEEDERHNTQKDVRVVSDYCIGPSCVIAYGCKHAILQNVGQKDHRTIIITDPCVAVAAKGHIYRLWDMGTPFGFLAQMPEEKRMLSEAR